MFEFKNNGFRYVSIQKSLGCRFFPDRIGGVFLYKKVVFLYNKIVFLIKKIVSLYYKIVFLYYKIVFLYNKIVYLYYKVVSLYYKIVFLYYKVVFLIKKIVFLVKNEAFLFIIKEFLSRKMGIWISFGGFKTDAKVILIGNTVFSSAETEQSKSIFNLNAFIYQKGDVGFLE